MDKKKYETRCGTVSYWVSDSDPREGACSGPELVFLPGLTADHRLFDKQIEYFEGKYRLFVWDAPGHADSYPFEMSFSLEDKAKWLHEILELEGFSNPVLIGQSMGGYVGQMYSQLYPDELSGFISIDSASLKRKNYSKADLWILKRMEPVYLHYPWKLLLKHGCNGVSESEYGRALMHSIMMTYDGDQERYAELAGHGFRIVAEAIEADLPYEIKCPALLICGTEDHVGYCLRYNKNWNKDSGIPIEWIKGAGHNSNTDEPDRINRLIEEFVEGKKMKSREIIVGEYTEYPLNGMLVLPDTTEDKVPGVVFVHGSGSSNMDEKIYNLTPFKDLAEGLAERGIASVRYDKRSFVHARKMFRNLKKQGITVEEETIQDAIRAAKLLRSDPHVDPDRVFIVGHSMGAMLAPRIDAEGGDFRGLVLMAGTPHRLEDIMIRQFKQAGQSKGFLMKMIVRLEDRIFSKKFDGLYEMSDEEAKKKKFAGGTTLWYFKEMGRKTAADYLNESDKPVLIMQGGMDFQVLAEDDYAQFREQLKDRGNVEYCLYENLNHLFVNGIYNDILKASKEYKVEQRIGPEVINDIADFILSK